MKYRVKDAEVKEGIVELPSGAIPLQVGLMMVKPLRDPDGKLILRDGVKYLEPIIEEETRGEYIKRPL